MNLGSHFSCLNENKEFTHTDSLLDPLLFTDLSNVSSSSRRGRKESQKSYFVFPLFTPFYVVTQTDTRLEEYTSNYTRPT